MDPERLPALLWGLLVLVIASITGAFLFTQIGPWARVRHLPVLGQVPDFSLVTSEGRTFDRENLRNHPTVVDFIFTSCSAQCPIVSAEMKRIQESSIRRWSSVRLLSLTVDPERDTPETLARYARDLGADLSRWQFLTGPARPLEALIRKGFLAATASPSPVDTSPGAILHSLSLVLVDPSGAIRGHYLATDREEMAQLSRDLAAVARVHEGLFSFRQLPELNAALNSLSFLLLLAGFLFIRRRRRTIHRFCMLAACTASFLFLVSYLTYHAQAGSVPFMGQGWVRPLYFTILLSHTVLAIVILPMVLMVLWRALRENFSAHRRLARWTLPLWGYVSLTGVLVYLMLYQLS